MGAGNRTRDRLLHQVAQVAAVGSVAGATTANAGRTATTAGLDTEVVTTGLRIGVAAVKGMAQVLQKPCVPVSALEGLAFNLYDRAGILCAALDARCGQVYAACFDADNQMARLTDDSALMAEELCEQLSQLPAGRPITVLGDGAQLVADTMQRLCPQRKLSIPGKHLLLQHAYGVGLAALHGIQSGRIQPILAEQLEPVYLKLPQAQRELMAKQAKQAAAQPKK